MNIFWNDICSGKYNIVLFIIFGILIFHIYHKMNCDKDKESFTPSETNEIKKAIREIYAADVESIKNLYEVATKLQKDGLTIPGNLIVTGTIISKGNLTVGEKGATDGVINIINKTNDNNNLKLQSGELNIPGSLNVTGSLKVTDTILSKGKITIGEKGVNDGEINIINKTDSTTGFGLKLDSNYDNTSSALRIVAVNQSAPIVDPNIEIINAPRIPLYSVYSNGNTCTSTDPKNTNICNTEDNKKIIGYVLKSEISGKTLRILHKYSARMTDSCLVVDPETHCHGESVKVNEDAYILKDEIIGHTTPLYSVYDSRMGDSCAITKNELCHGSEKSQLNIGNIIGHIFIKDKS